MQKITTAVVGSSSPPTHADLVGYETLIQFMKKNKTLSANGDLVEIGTFLGGGAYKLSKFLDKEQCQKKLYVVDVFDPGFDLTKATSGLSMSTIYNHILKGFEGKSQWQIFCDITKDLRNIVTIKSDSTRVILPCKELCFGFIDGNHDPKYVESDFYLIWDKLSPNGVIAFHDYEFDLPQTTSKIKQLVSSHLKDIRSMHHNKKKHILFISKN
ncbi:MAG: class I SAM-dependent methyltransferase [Halobacteriota archaeon]